MAYAGTAPQVRIPRVKIEVKIEKGRSGGGGPGPEDPRSRRRRALAAMRDLFGSWGRWSADCGHPPSPRPRPAVWLAEAR
jgi:hypothetical protein